MFNFGSGWLFPVVGIVANKKPPEGGFLCPRSKASRACLSYPSRSRMGFAIRNLGLREGDVSSSPVSQSGHEGRGLNCPSRGGSPVELLKSYSVET